MKKRDRLKKKNQQELTITLPSTPEMEEQMAKADDIIKKAREDKNSVVGYLTNVLKRYSGFFYASAARIDRIHESPKMRSLFLRRLMTGYGLRNKFQKGDPDFIKQWCDPNYTPGEYDDKGFLKDPKWIERVVPGNTIIVSVHSILPPLTEEGLYEAVDKTICVTALQLDDTPDNFYPCVVCKRDGRVYFGDPFSYNASVTQSAIEAILKSNNSSSSTEDQEQVK